jgi:hypothetical protein
MGICRALPLAALVVAIPLAASAQFGGMPGLPGGTPGGLPGVEGLGAPPPQPAPLLACRDLLALRDEIQRHGIAIQKSNERKATVQEACKLFRLFLTAEAQYIKELGDNSRMCGVPPDAIKRAEEGHTKASHVGNQVCDAAARRGPRPAGPGLEDVLIQDSRNPGQFRYYEHGCRDCGKSGDFWWLDERYRRPR